MNALLKGRDQRNHQINDLLQLYPVIISIKANTPGENKDSKEAFILVRIFNQVIKEHFSIKHQDFLNDGEGPVFLLCLDISNSIKIKETMVDIEDHHPLGRLVDLDVYSSQTSISRKDLGYAPRKCFLCEKDAHLCSRGQTHSFLELNIYICESVRAYLKKWLEEMIDDAMMRELKLEYKFGCVTKTSSGSHTDMNYELMLKAKNAIKPYLIDLFFLAYEYDDSYDLLSEARKIGQEAEIKMLKATNQINAYKGLIFILGFLLIGMGIDLRLKQIKSSLFDIIKDISQPINKDFIQDTKTFGMYAYKTYQIKGARGEVLDGFPTLQKLSSKYQSKQPLSDDLLREILIDIILLTDDTVLLKRSKDMDAYHQFKEKLKHMNPNDKEQVQEMNSYAINNKLSQGGSADLLVGYLCLNAYDKIFNIN